MERQRFIDIDCAKGLAIIFVVIGHIVARGFPLGNEWFIFVKQAVYTFHMPLFMFLSGWVFYYTYPKSDDLKQLKDFILKKAYRLLVPFFSMAIIIISGKYLAGKVMYVDHPVNNLFASIKNVFLHTDKSCVGFIWYVYVVFVFIVFTLLWTKLFKSKTNLVPLIILGLIMESVKIPAYFYLNLIGRNYIYFVLGCLAFQHKDKYYELIVKNAYNFVLIFILSLGLYLTSIHFHYDIFGLKLFVAFFAILGIHGIIKSKTDESSILLKISKYTFPIYLFNVPLIGLTKAVMLKFMSWDGINFLIFLPVLFIAGLYGSVLLRKIFLEKIPVLNKLTI